MISIISVNVKYHRYFDITELDGKDKYTTEWGNVSIDGARILSKKEMIGEYPDIESYIKSEDDSKGYVMIISSATNPVTHALCNIPILDAVIREPYLPHRLDNTKSI